MKIIILNSGRKFTGEAAHTLDLAEQLSLHGHDVRLVTRVGSQQIERAEQRGIPVAATLNFLSGFKPRATFHDLYHLRNLIKAEQPDILHCHSGTDHGLAVAAVAGLRNPPPIVRTRHRVLPVKNSVSNRWLFLRATAGVLAVSQKAADSFGPMLPMLQDRLSVIYSSVDTTNFHPDRRCGDWRTDHGLADDQPLIGLIARLQRVKGQEHFLRAAAIIVKEFPNARFLVAGTGPAHKRPRMEKLIAELGLTGRVIIKEWLPDIHTVVASLDVGVLASIGSEGSSRVTYEYMASGVPVVATTVGCIPEIVEHGKTGLLVPPADSQAMADAILNILRLPRCGLDMRQEALSRVHKFHNRTRWIDDIIAAYEQARTRARLPLAFPALLRYYRAIITGK